MYVKHDSKEKTKAGLRSADSISRSPENVLGFLLEDNPNTAMKILVSLHQGRHREWL